MAERDIIARIVVEGGQQAATQLDNVAKSEREIVAATKEANTALDAQGNQLKENSNATKANVSAQQSLKKQLRELKAQLAQLAIAGKQNTAEYKRLRDEAGNLADAIGDVNAEISQAGSDTRGLDQVIRVASTATAAFGLVEGAAALFGDENEELQKSLLKVNAAMTILTSLQQIQTEITRKDSIFTVAAAKAKALYAAATAGATGATKAFRVALIATGVGIALIALGVFIANWDKLKAAINASQRSLDILNKTLEQNKKISDQANTQREFEISLLEAQGASLDVINNKVRENARLRVGELRARLLELQAIRNQELQQIDNERFLFNAEQKRQEKRQEAENKYQEQVNEVNNLINQQKVIFTQAGTELVKFQEERRKNAEEAAKEQREALAEFEELQREYKKIADELLAPIQIPLPEFDKGSIGDLQSQINGLQESLKAISPDSDLFFSISFQINNLTKKLEELRKKSDEAGTSLEIDFNKIREAIKNAAEETPDDTGLLETFKKQEEAIRRIPILATKSLSEEIDIRKKAGEDTTKLEEELQNNRVQIAQNAANQALGFFTQIQNARLAILQNKLDQGLISEEEYNKEVAKINRQQAVAEKAKALFDIALATGVAIVNALKAGPAGPALAGLIAGLAALQTALVLSTPIPKFRYGGQVLEGGSISPEGMLSGRSHAGGGMLIEAEGGEFITRREMTKKYLPILKAINQDKLGDVLYPKIPIMRTFGSVATQSQRKADKRMEMLIEEVQFMSQYIRQGNKYARVTAETNTQLTKQKQSKHYV